MARIIKSLFGYDFETATPEEKEAYRVANEALHYRVHVIARQSYVHRNIHQPTTDAFGRPL